MSVLREGTLERKPPTRAAPFRAPVVLALAVTTLTWVPAPALAQSPEQIVNGTFDSGHAPWWGTSNITLDSSSGELCADIPGATVNPWDVIIGQDNVPLVAGETYRYSFVATAAPDFPGRALIQLPVDPWTQYLAVYPQMTAEANTYTYTFTSPVSLPNAQVAFQIGGSATPWRFCVDNVSLQGGAPPDVYKPDTGPRVRVNQVGYLTHGPKNATLVTEATNALPWQLVNGSGTVVARGSSTPRGVDISSGQNVHSIDFSGYVVAGVGYTLVADGETSRPFDLGGNLYGQLRDDALKFYYPQRNGIEILGSLRPGYARPAGHLGVAPNAGDTAVPCQPGVCDYTLDVSSGWYDAGDHGKYVVNGGISVFQLMNAFERTRYARAAQPFTDGQLAIPESGNGVPDILDEARWEMEFLLRMQVPAGKPLAGMVHHKVHDNEWTGLPLLPHLDPKQRELHPPSTAATLNLAATAAQAARLFAPYDPAFARRSLTAARAAWAAALAHPALHASPSDSTGGGAYEDSDVRDEFYWAAAELFLTTGEAPFRDFVLGSPLHTADIWSEQGINWREVAALARMDLAMVPSNLPDRAAVRLSVVAGATKYLNTLNAHAYGLPYAPADNMFAWGSTSQVLNNMVVLATAHDITGDKRFADGVAQGMDYILGRNALNISYVTGYGEVSAENQHSRWYAHQLNPALPHPPRGTLSGGPNSSLQDPIVQQKLKGCVAQFCFIDDIESYSTNELTINWNAPLAWIAAFLAGQGDGSAAPAASCQVSYVKQDEWNDGFNVQVTLHNTGASAINGWTLRWSFLGGQTVTQAWSANASQSGATVSATHLPWNALIPPGGAVSFGFLGAPAAGPNPTPALFTLNGAACQNK
ncbi:glycoside hydrolase family 9 protein [Cystobacter fuscus]|uniref:glycoside hydrolase family 9 protein n=1 Tax=Cystobacter fuscus TaxID=43 RepID=UPI0037C0BA41